MVSLYVDERKCVGDGICLDECPARLLELKDESHVPSWITGAETMCVNCGHCVTICPEGAISLSTMRAELCPPVQRELFFSPAQAEQHLRARRSVRNYQKRPVEREILARLIDSARFAPSASNGQPLQWLVVYDEEEVRRIAGHTVDWLRGLLDRPNTFSPRVPRAVEFFAAGDDMTITGNAPHLLLTLAPQSDAWARIDSAIALTYVELAAMAFGLGTCWGGLLTMAANAWTPLRQALGLAAEQACCGAMMIGYPLQEHLRIPLRNPARVTWL